MAAQQLSEQDPQRIGDWELRAVLGRGGFGVVYLGERSDGTVAAVKLIHNWLTGDEPTLRRFEREGQLLRRIDSRCTVRVLDLGTAHDRPFIACEYVEGPTLAEHVEQAGPLAGGELTAFALGLADALAAIHDAGVVHRDLTATNVMLASGGPKVLDFGIARHIDESAVTRTGTTVGTPRWMAPEQIRGGDPTFATDVFAWGATVAFAASGVSPFGTGAADAVLYRTIHEEPDLPALDEPLAGLVAAALSKDPDRRPGPRVLTGRLLRPTGATTVSVALDQTWSFTPTVPLTAATTPLAAATEPSDRRSRRLVMASLAAALLVGGGGSAWWVTSSQRAKQLTTEEVAAEEHPNSEPASEPATDPTEEPEPTVEPEQELTVEEELEPEPEEVATTVAPRPSLPTAPWDTPAVDPTDATLLEATRWWSRTSLPDCGLYGPTEMVTGFEMEANPGGVEFTRVGDFQFGWDHNIHFAYVSIWTTDDPNLGRYVGREPLVEYADGSVTYEDPSGTGVLIACLYEVSYDSNVTRAWMINTFRPVRVP